MKKLDYLLNTAIYALYMFASCFCAMLVEAFTVKVLNLLVEIDYFYLCIIRIAIYTVVVLGLIFILAFREGYREVKFSPLLTILSSLTAGIIHFLFALLFGFQSFVAGGVRFISAIIEYGSSLVSSEQIDGMGYGIFIIVFFVSGIVYCIDIALAKRFGCQKRLIDREELTGSKE